jgi:SAM-dependent methyltransferase
MVREIVGRVTTVVREEGPAVALNKIVRGAVRFFHGHRSDNFDTAFKIDTWKEVPLWRLHVPSENASFGSKYQTTDPTVFLDAIRRVPAELREFTFVDLGCGKGRTLILAAKQGFQKVIGVEFSPELAAIARQNLHQVGVDADIMEGDASRFHFGDGDQLIYMYNPFGRSVMRSVIDNLADWRTRHPNKAFVVYINPVCQREFDSSPVFRSVVRGADLAIWELL